MIEEKNINYYLPNEILRQLVKISIHNQKDFLTLSLVCGLWKHFVADMDPQEVSLTPSFPIPNGLKAIQAGRLTITPTMTYLRLI